MKQYHVVIVYTNGLSCSVTHAKGESKADVFKYYSERENDPDKILSITVIEAP